ncbi:hypothetical protein GEMRC1_011120 [Eukaryota sp. GEM-RC1]
MYTSRCEMHHCANGRMRVSLNNMYFDSDHRFHSGYRTSASKGCLCTNFLNQIEEGFRNSSCFFFLSWKISGDLKLSYEPLSHQCSQTGQQADFCPLIPLSDSESTINSDDICEPSDQLLYLKEKPLTISLLEIYRVV